MKISASFIKYFLFTMIAIVGVSGLTTLAVYRPSSPSLQENERQPLDQLLEADRIDCNIVGIDLYGGILTYLPEQNPYSEEYNPDVIASKYVTYYIEKANEASDIDAVIFDVDSSGGVAAAAEEIANAINTSSKPVVAVIRQRGLSAAYWAVSSADRIFASKNSDVGSIGVTSSYVDQVGTNAKEGNQFIELTAGKYKDIGNPNRPLTQEEQQLWLNDLEIIHQNFITAVATNRHLPVEDVQKIADGWSVLGEQALQQQLIDEIGGLSEAEEYLKTILGKDLKICWY